MAKKLKRPPKGYLEYGDLSKGKTRSARGLYPSGKDILGKEAGYGLNYPETEPLVANKPKPIPKKSLAPKKSVRPKTRPKAKPFQRLSAREAAELKHSGVKYDGIPEGSVPATVMPSPKPGEGMSARDRAEMGMKKGGKVRGAGIARKGVRAAKMR